VHHYLHTKTRNKISRTDIFDGPSLSGILYCTVLRTHIVIMCS